MRSRLVALSLSGMLLFSCAGNFTLSKEESAAVGGLIGAGIAAATHKHYKAKAKDAAIYGAVAGGIIGYVLGSDKKNYHTVDASTCYDVVYPSGKKVHVCENWHTVDSQPAPRLK